MSRRHGEATYLLIGEGVFADSIRREGEFESIKAEALMEGIDSPHSIGLKALLNMLPATTARVFRYGRMFRSPKLRKFRPETSALIELGNAMEQQTDPGDNPHLPAGYVYLGQFIDHDMTFDQNQDFPAADDLEPEVNIDLRSPSLDLDSLYGYDPDLVKRTELGKKIYADDGIKLREGETIAETMLGTKIKVEQTFKNDLPRIGNGGKALTVVNAQAAIVDERNDENLAVAQTHVAFIKFHNAVVDQLSDKYSGTALFEAAREKVVRHYQWIILFDYLPRIVEPNVLEDVIENGCKYMVFARDEEPFMPVEFSVAAFRFGHSLVRAGYNWNRFFELPPEGLAIAELKDLFVITGFHGMNLRNNWHLPGSWIIDWTRFYDFANIAGVENSPRPNKARKFSPSIVSPLMKLPAFRDNADQNMRRLSVRNLLRGRLLGLPSGQDVARRLNETPLTAAEIADGPHRDTLTGHGFDEATPLWYYILKEAEIRHNGERLGPVGSRIVAETLVELIRKSTTSILPRESTGGPVWQPDLGTEAAKFSMPDLLYFVHQHSGNYLNPLG